MEQYNQLLFKFVCVLTWRPFVRSYYPKVLEVFDSNDSTLISQNPNQFILFLFILFILLLFITFSLYKYERLIKKYYFNMGLFYYITQRTSRSDRQVKFVYDFVFSLKHNKSTFICVLVYTYLLWSICLSFMGFAKQILPASQIIPPLADYSPICG